VAARTSPTRLPPNKTAKPSHHYEGELVIVISKRVRRLTAKDTPNYILGHTIGNDVSEWVPGINQMIKQGWGRASSTSPR
jgi:2-keto-4-pentenoate hydratase/2-oxohepta-3-ene-1,7-dioic acid hydratase in catechol pathway